MWGGCPFTLKYQNTHEIQENAVHPNEMSTHPPMITNEVEFLPSASIMLSAVLDFAGGFLALLAPGYVAGWMGYDGVNFSIQSASVRIMGECAVFDLFASLLFFLPSSASSFVSVCRGADPPILNSAVAQFCPACVDFGGLLSFSGFARIPAVALRGLCGPQAAGLKLVDSCFFA